MNSDVRRAGQPSLRAVPLGLAPSFGFGDRLGLATPGHVAALRRAGAGIEPIFPQQSTPEMARPRRSPPQGMKEALDGMPPARWAGGNGAGARHLETKPAVGAPA